MENRRNIVSFFILAWRILLVAGSQRCNMDLCTAPDLTNSSELYELQLSSQQYSTTENGKMQLSVQVKMAVSCPSLQSPGVKYYKLESYSNSSLEPAGTFNEPRQSSEAELCANNEIVFLPCEPSVTDLPRTYGWNAPASYVGDICFRLIIVTDDDESSCEEVIECISPDSPPTTDPAPMIGLSADQNQNEKEDDQVEIHDEEVTVEVDLSSFDSKHVENCYKRRNCTNAKLKTMCGTDYKEYQSRCHVKLEACLHKSNLDIMQPGECPPTTTTPPPPPTGPCIDDRRAIMNSPAGIAYGWIPNCDCNGNYKPIQCNPVSGECWCSTIRGHLRGPRQRFCEQRTDFSHCLLS